MTSHQTTDQFTKLDDLQTTLEAWTSNLISSFTTRVKETQPEELEQLTEELLNEHTEKPPEGKDLTSVLGKFALTLVARLKVAENELANQQTTILSLQEENETLKGNLEQSQEENDKTQNQLDEALQDLDRAESEKERLMHNNDTLHQDNNELEDALQDTKKELRRVEGQLENVKKDYKECQLLLKERHEHRDIHRAPSPDSRFEYGRPRGQRACAPSDRDLDKIARNITKFDPGPTGSPDAKVYLQDIDYYLRKYPDATTDDRIYLIKLTSNRSVSKFIDRQPTNIKADYMLLREAIEKEFSDDCLQAGLTAALAVKQGRSEPTQAYYQRLLLAYFGSQNTPGMEEDHNFKTLFIQNLHPTVSHYLGVTANPRSNSISQLREFAHYAFQKQQQSRNKHAEPATVLAISDASNTLELEGAPRSTPPLTPRVHQQPKHFSNRPHQGQNHTRSSGYHFGPTLRKPDYRRRPYPRDRSRERDTDYHDDRYRYEDTRNRDKWSPSHHRSSEAETYHKPWKEEETPTFSREAIEIVQHLLAEIQNYKENKTANILAISAVPTQNKRSKRRKRKKKIPHANEEGPKDSTQSSAVMAAQPQVTDHSSNDISQLCVEPPVPQFLCDLNERGVARKFYLPLTLEDMVCQDAVLDTAADITLMSHTLFDKLRVAANRANKHLKLEPCSLAVRPYALTKTTLLGVSLLNMSIGPMTLTHPVYVSKLDAIPLLVGKDLLNRFEPLIDFKNLKLWAQTQHPHPFDPTRTTESQCFVLNTLDTPSLTQLALLEQLQPIESDRQDQGEYCPKEVKSHLQIQGQAKHSNDLENSMAEQKTPNGPLETLDTHDSMVVSHFETHPPTHEACMVTRATPTGSLDPLKPQLFATTNPTFANARRTVTQPCNQMIHKTVKHRLDKTVHALPASKPYDIPKLKPLHATQSSLQLCNGTPVHASDEPSSPPLRVPRNQRGVMTANAYNIPAAEHKSVKTTYKAPKAVFQNHSDRFAKRHKAYNDQKLSHDKLRRGDKIFHPTFVPQTPEINLQERKITPKFLPEWMNPHIVNNKLWPLKCQTQDPIFKWAHQNQSNLYQNPMGLVGYNTVKVSP